MSDQLSFFEEPKPPTDRLFFAVLPDAATAQRAAQLTQQLRREHSLQGKAVAIGKLHVTLQFVGDLPGLSPKLIAALSHKAAKVSVPQFTASFDYASSFAGRSDHRPLVLRGGDGLSGLFGLYRELTAALGSNKPPITAAPAFTPHMTLFYGSPLAHVDIEPIEWTVNEFVLIRSEMRSGKPYEVLGRWALQGG